MANGTSFTSETMEDAMKSILDKVTEEKKKIGHVNIVVAGKTGAGKSTLINTVFGDELAKTGTGHPVTKEVKEISKEGYPLRIYDTVGLELGQKDQNTSKENIIKLIKDKMNTRDYDQMIHCIWYCVVGDCSRFEDEEANFVNELSEKFGDIPVIVVITKSATSMSKELQEHIEKLNLNIAKTIRVLAVDCQIDEDYVKKAYGCDELVDFVVENIPAKAQKAFIAAQKISLKHKRALANAAVMTTAAAAAAEGFIPLPFSDALALIPTQIGMIGTITATYGLKLSKSNMAAVITSLVGTQMVTIAGKSIVSAALKMIPGLGTILGGTISGATASVLTIALGETFICIMDKIALGEMKVSDLQDDDKMKEFKDMFKTNYRIANKNRKNGVH